MSVNEDWLFQLIGERIFDLRENANVSQAVLGIRVGLSRSAIANIEAGKQRLPIHTLYNICVVLGGDPLAVLPTLAELKTPPKPVKMVVGEDRASVPARAAASVKKRIRRYQK